MNGSSDYRVLDCSMVAGWCKTAIQNIENLRISKYADAKENLRQTIVRDQEKPRWFRKPSVIVEPTDDELEERLSHNRDNYWGGYGRLRPSIIVNRYTRTNCANCKPFWPFVTTLKTNHLAKSTSVGSPLP